MQVIYFLAMALTSESFIAERAQVQNYTSGKKRENNYTWQTSESSHYMLGQSLLERSWICGVLPFEILASHILSQLGVILVQALSYHNYMQAFSLTLL